jgi:hypothetical protein
MPSDLIAIIREKQEAIAKLQAELDEAKQLLLGAATIATVAHPAAKVERIGTVVRVHGVAGLSSTAMAASILRDAGHPLHVSDIIRGIQRKFGREVKKDTLVGNISRLINDNKVFTRTGPNFFALREDAEAMEPTRAMLFKG